MTGKIARHYLGFNDLWFMVWGIPILGFFIPTVFFDIPLDFRSQFLYVKWAESTVYAAANWLIARTLIIYFRRYFEDRPNALRNRMIFQTVSYLLASNLIAGLCLTLLIQSIVNIDSYQPSWFESNVATITAYITIGAVYEAVYFMKKWKESELVNEQLQRQKTQAQLNSLRSQVNPHFLFNSLNALVSLIPTDPNKASEFARKLSQTYRYILSMRDNELIELKEELDFLSAYQFLNEVRYGDSIRFHIDIDEKSKHKFITPMALQILVENAIKHNVVSSSAPLQIDLYNEKGNLIVRNNYQLKQQKMESTGAGLENINARYKFIADREIDVIHTKDHFMVVLPLLEKPVS